MNQDVKNLGRLALAILIMSSSGVLARYIDLPTTVIIWIRCFIGVIVLYLYIRLARESISIKPGKHLIIVLGSSVLLGLHWITYFESVKLSNIAVAMLALFTYPVMTVLLEPLILKTRFTWSELLLAGLSVVGIFFLLPAYQLSDVGTIGVIVALCSALFYTLRNLLLKMTLVDYSGTALMFYQLLVLTVLILPFTFFYGFDFDIIAVPGQWRALLILGIFTTAIGHTLLVQSFAHFSITLVSIISCMTPLLGILLGIIFLKEIPNIQVVFGGVLILTSSIISSLKGIRKL